MKKINLRIFSFLIIALFILLYSCSKHEYNNDINYDEAYSYANSTFGYLRNGNSSMNTINLNIYQASSNANKLIDIDTVSLNFQITGTLTADLIANVSGDNSLITAYNTAHGTSYLPFPNAAYSFVNSDSVVSISKGNKSSDNIKISINNLSGFTAGNTYILPLTLKTTVPTGLTIASNFQTNYIIVTFAAMPSYPPIKKPTNIKTIMYMEVNDVNPLNAGSYKIYPQGADTSKVAGAMLFDFVSIFAANVNYDATLNKPIIYFNQQVNAIISNRDKYIKPLQAQGQKVLLTLLPNHQGAGFTNFTSYSAINDFATQIKDVIYKYNFDGVDFDDEYADYGTNGLPYENDSSFVLLIKRVRELMPDKLITLYNIGAIAYNNSWKGIQAGAYLDYAWNPYYGVFSIPNIAGLTDKLKLGPAAVQVAGTGASTTSLSTRTVTGGYGMFVYYNLQATNSASYFTYSSKILYSNYVTLLSGPLYSKDY
ncbi:BT_3987 domain-containing protein [Rhizosphaericola mali]|uniref:DUF1735 domain-containing protein n=1 Tax=Rhizosphaericola mali TaxID=2545455 RepID=A0A5P2G0H1_9BACT|nr:DUF1735 domain-containing protein [Rhizosphaericola mali]QES88677.1 DUF1735 domain-containing protein [Rhizosphaericola mali]